MNERIVLSALQGSAVKEAEVIACTYVEPALEQLDKKRNNQLVVEQIINQKFGKRDSQPNGHPHHMPPALHSLTSETPMRRY